MRGLTTKGHTIDLIDLHADGFNPIMSYEELAAWRKKKTIDPLVANYQQRLMAAGIPADCYEHARLCLPLDIWQPYHQNPVQRNLPQNGHTEEPALV
jgi:hypothetical protein